MAERLGSKRGGYAGSKPITISYNLIDGYRVLKKLFMDINYLRTYSKVKAIRHNLKHRLAISILRT